VGLSLATLSAILLLGHIAGGSGLVFLGTMAIYIVARQALLRLRAEARPFSWRRAPGRAVAKS